MAEQRKRPFFARFLDSSEMRRIVGGDAGGHPNDNATWIACQQNPNAGDCLIFVTLKAGKCGNDCDTGDLDTVQI